jgi:hypothetical protein
MSTILDKIKAVKDSKLDKNEKKKVLTIFEKFKQAFQKTENLITEAKKAPKAKTTDKVIKELEKLLAKQEKEFVKVANRLKLELDQDMMVVANKKNMKKIENITSASGGIYTFNYSDPLTRNFTAENPLDTKPLGVFIANVGLGSDGSIHCVMINIHHIPASYRKHFWNWILREFLIAGKSNRRKLEIPETLYYILRDNPELRYALQGYRRYSYKQITNLKKLPLSEYDNIFNQKYKARFKIWNEQKNKFIQRPGK